MCSEDGYCKELTVCSKDKVKMSSKDVYCSKVCSEDCYSKEQYTVKMDTVKKMVCSKDVTVNKTECCEDGYIEDSVK